jgi:hypothetical protein
VLHVDGNPFAAAVTFQIRGNLKLLAALRAADGAAGFNGDNLRAMLSQ